MKHLKYCPQYGNETLVFENDRKFSCNSCEFVLYHNCAPAVAVIVKCGNEILFTRRNQNPAKGKLDLAGGFVDPKETAESACARELFEELNITIDKTKLILIKTLPNVYHYKNINYNTLDLFYEYEVNEKFSVDLELSEVSEIVWIDANNIPIEKIAFESQKMFFEEY